MGDLHNNKIQILFHLVDPNQVHESLVVPAGVDPFRWEDWFLRVNENLHQVISRNSSFGRHLKHLLMVEKIVKIPLSDCSGIVFLEERTKRYTLATSVQESSQTYPCPPWEEAHRVSSRTRTWKKRRKQVCERENSENL